MIGLSCKKKSIQLTCTHGRCQGCLQEGAALLGALTYCNNFLFYFYGIKTSIAPDMITSTDQDLEEKKALPESVLILGKVVSQTGGCCPSLLGHKPRARCKLEVGVLDKNRNRNQPFPRQSFSSEETVDTARYNTHAPSSWKQRWKSKPS